MKPLLVNTSDRGGAAKACIRLHQGLIKEGIESRLLVGHKSNNSIPGIYQYCEERRLPIKQRWTEKTKRILNEFRLYDYHVRKNTEEEERFLKSRSPYLECFSFPTSSYDIEESLLYQQSDLIHLHWVAEYLNYPTFFKINTKPLVWTLHDQNPFLGGEHYDETVIGFNDQGYPVKRVRTRAEIEENKRIEDIKRNAYCFVRDLTIVCPSRWLANLAVNSELLGKFPVLHIPYGLDTSVYNIRDKEYSRRLLGIEGKAKVLLFVADGVANPRKGFAVLQKALESVSKEIQLLVVGAGKTFGLHNDNVKTLGFVYDELLMSIIYSAADFFVIPSLMDNLPNTVMESLCCGTPVIGFRVGGIPDMVQHGVNGLLCDDICAPALAKTLNEGLVSIESFDNHAISNNARFKFDDKIRTEDYIEVYKGMLGKK